jgi:hypothetical protein
VKPERQIDWERLKTIALSLGLPGIEETTSRGQPTLKAHGKLWVWWSPHEDALVFQVAFEEREILVEAEPSAFFVTAHYKGHPLVLVRPEKLDLEWAKASLIRVWRAQAPRVRILLPGSAVRTGVPVPVCPAQHLQRFNLRPTCWR